LFNPPQLGVTLGSPVAAIKDEKDPGWVVGHIGDVLVFGENL
jgi:hypothetical protein